MIDALKNYCYKILDINCRDLEIHLIRFNGKSGIIKCAHTEKEKIIELLNSINMIGRYHVNIQTVATSGTIKTLIKKNPVLKNLERNKRKKIHKEKKKPMKT